MTCNKSDSSLDLLLEKDEIDINANQLIMLL